MRLSRWNRIGIVLAVLWAVGAAIYQRTADVRRAEDFATLAYSACSNFEAQRGNGDLTRCNQELAKNLSVWLEGSWGNVAFFALAPIPFAWVLVVLAVKVARWIKAGN